MRGSDIQQDTLFSRASPESPVPKDYPLRPIRAMADKALKDLDSDFNALYSEYSAGTAAGLSYLGHILIENRNGLVTDAQVTQATGTAKRDAAVTMVESLGGTHRVTLGADKNYDTRDCVERLRRANTTPHVAQNTSNRSSAIDGRTTHHEGYEVSQFFRKRIDEILRLLCASVMCRLRENVSQQGYVGCVRGDRPPLVTGNLARGPHLQTYQCVSQSFEGIFHGIRPVRQVLPSREC